MDLNWVVSVVGFVVLVAVIAIFKPSPPSKNGGHKHQLIPPGSFGLPLVGETLDFLRMSKPNKGQDFFEHRVEKYGDIFKTHLFGCPTVVLYSPEGNRFLFSNENKLVHIAPPASLTSLFGNSLLSKVGDEAKDVRSTLLTFLRPEALESCVERVDSIVIHHIQRCWIGKQQVDAFPLIKRCLFSGACTLFLSLYQGPQQDELYHHFMDLLKGLLRIKLDFPGTLYRKANTARGHMRRILQTLIDQRRKDLANGSAKEDQDMLSCLLCNATELGNRLTDDEIMDNILVFLMAGHDTSVITVTFLLKYLALNPHCRSQLAQEQLEIEREMEERDAHLLKWVDLQKMKYSWRAAQETLRIHPPTGGTWRKAIVDISYGGFTIPKGWKVFWTTSSTHRKAQYFEDPEKFDPSRFEKKRPEPYTFLPFGGGPRMCPGNEFARMVILVFVHRIALNFEWELVDVDERVVVDPMPAPAKGLPITLRQISSITA